MKIPAKKVSDTRTSTLEVTDDAAYRARAQKSIDGGKPEVPKEVMHTSYPYSGYWRKENTGQVLMAHLPKMPKFAEIGRSHRDSEEIWESLQQNVNEGRHEMGFPSRTMFTSCRTSPR